MTRTFEILRLVMHPDSRAEELHDDLMRIYDRVATEIETTVNCGVRVGGEFSETMGSFRG